MNDALKNEIVDTLGKYRLCVMATVTSDGRPQAAIVGYTFSQRLELLIGTSLQTRKYTNLQHDQHVAVTIGDFAAEVQYEGTARQLDAAEVNDALIEQFGKLPGKDEYIQDPNQRWFVITPSWLRLTVHEDPNRIEEMTEFA